MIKYIFVYRNPSYPEFITIAAKSDEKVKEFRIPENEAEKISDKSFSMVASGKWNCYPYLFEHNGFGYTLARNW